MAHLLVVDDYPALLDALALLLRVSGHAVVPASNGDAAQASFAQGRSGSSVRAYGSR